MRATCSEYYHQEWTYETVEIVLVLIRTIFGDELAICLEAG
jgi:hypothetical protein